MTKSLLILCFTCLFTLSASGLSNHDQLISKADSYYFDNEDFASALTMYKQIKQQIDSTHKDYAFTVEQIARTLFYLEMEARYNNETEKSIKLSKDFVDITENYTNYIEPVILEKKYFMYKNIIVGYFALDQKEDAKPYQDKLYKAFENNELPDGIDKYYNFEMFTWEGLNIWGYELYPQLGDPETNRSFSKHIYYIYSTDDNGNDKDQLFTLQTVKIHKFERDGPDYVLTKRKYIEDRTISQSIWSYTFYDPVDYDLLHDAVVEFLKNNFKPDTKK